jgi:hypothetical protein
MDIIKVTGIARGVAISVFILLYFLLYKLGDFFPQLTLIENDSYVFIILDLIKFIALLAFIFLFNWRAIYLIRIKGYSYQSVLEVIISIGFTLLFIASPFLIEYIFDIKDSDIYELLYLINMTKLLSIQIFFVFILAIITAVFWKKDET